MTDERMDAILKNVCALAWMRPLTGIPVYRDVVALVAEVRRLRSELNDVPESAPIVLAGVEVLATNPPCVVFVPQG